MCESLCTEAKLAGAAVSLQVLLQRWSLDVVNSTHSVRRRRSRCRFFSAYGNPFQLGHFSTSLTPRAFVDNRTNGVPQIRRTKIVATLGPATGDESTIAALIQAGTNVVRINASHGTPELRAEWIEAARRVAGRSDSPVAILLDLQGPRIRVGHLP